MDHYDSQMKASVDSNLQATMTHLTCFVEVENTFILFTKYTKLFSEGHQRGSSTIIRVLLKAISKNFEMVKMAWLDGPHLPT